MENEKLMAISDGTDDIFLHHLTVPLIWSY